MVRQVVLVDDDEDVAWLDARVLAGQFRDPPVQGLLALGGPAGSHGDVDEHDAVVAVHAQVAGVVPERPGRPVVAGQHLEQIVCRDADRVDQGVLDRAADRVQTGLAGAQRVNANERHGVLLLTESAGSAAGRR
jgi:hypothetical protein